MATFRENISPARTPMKTMPLSDKQPSGKERAGTFKQSARESFMSTKCNAKTEVYSRVCGFFRPVQQWNKGKKSEFQERQEYVVDSPAK